MSMTNGQTALHLAAMTEQWEVVKYLVQERNMDVYERGEGPFGRETTMERSPSDVRDWLVEWNLHENAKRTALHSLIGDGNREMVKNLVEGGAELPDFNQRYKDGLTALQYGAGMAT